MSLFASSHCPITVSCILGIVSTNCQPRSWNHFDAPILYISPGLILPYATNLVYRTDVCTSESGVDGHRLVMLVGQEKQSVTKAAPVVGSVRRQQYRVYTEKFLLQSRFEPPNSLLVRKLFNLTCFTFSVFSGMYVNNHIPGIGKIVHFYKSLIVWGESKPSLMHKALRQ